MFPEKIIIKAIIIMKKMYYTYRFVTVMASLSAYSVTEPLGLTLGVNAH